MSEDHTLKSEADRMLPKGDRANGKKDLVSSPGSGEPGSAVAGKKGPSGASPGSPLSNFLRSSKGLKIILLVLFLSTVFFVVVSVKMIKENNECVANPYTYSVKRIVISSDENNYNIVDPICSCDLGIAGKFYYDTEGIYKDYPRKSILMGGSIGSIE